MGLLSNPSHYTRKEDIMGCCCQICHVGQKCMSRPSRPLQSKRRPIAYQAPSHISRNSNFCSLVDELDQHDLSGTQLTSKQCTDPSWMVKCLLLRPGRTRHHCSARDAAGGDPNNTGTDLAKHFLFFREQKQRTTRSFSP